MPTNLPIAGPLAGCTLDLDGLRVQRDRYRALGESACGIERRGEELLVRFDAALNEPLLHETLAVEAECCPFFRFHYSTHERLLRVGVAEPDQLPALDAIGFALGTTA